MDLFVFFVFGNQNGPLLCNGYRLAFIVAFLGLYSNGLINQLLETYFSLKVNYTGSI